MVSRPRLDRRSPCTCARGGRPLEPSDRPVSFPTVQFGLGRSRNVEPLQLAPLSFDIHRRSPLSCVIMGRPPKYKTEADRKAGRATAAARRRQRHSPTAETPSSAQPSGTWQPGNVPDPSQQPPPSPVDDRTPTVDNNAPEEVRGNGFQPGVDALTGELTTLRIRTGTYTTVPLGCVSSHQLPSRATRSKPALLTARRRHTHGGQP